jgi:hypothetical protein
MKKQLQEQVATHKYARSVGITHATLLEDDQREEIEGRQLVYRENPPQKHDTIYVPAEDNLYNTRLPSSARTYKAPPTPAQTRTKKRVVMRVTEHDGPPPIPTPRASRVTGEASGQKSAKYPQSPAHQQPVLQKSPSLRLHWLFYVGSILLASVTLWIAGSCAFSWLQSEYDNLTYGTPRTFQIDQDVKHGGVSHFTVENLNGNIIVIEVDQSNLAQSRLYQGPVFSGPGTDDYIATLAFKDVNGDNKPDMIIKVGNGRYVYINTGNGFRPSTPADKITNQEVN